MADPEPETAFTIGCWHPFGPHGGETPAEILARKRREIAANGWTLWSFQYRRSETLRAWARELAGPRRVFVCCSHSASAVDPAVTGAPVTTATVRSYRFIDADGWQPLPPGVAVPHPFRGRRRQASAFVIRRIIDPVEAVGLPAVEWLAAEGRWRPDRVPTRGEYLIRAGGTTPLRAVRALLELHPPYLALVSADDAANPERAAGVND
jgi:hypothetical protein